MGTPVPSRPPCPEPWTGRHPFARFFTIFFALTTAAVLVLAERYNSRHGIAGEEFPATVLFAAFGMVTLSASVNLLTFFLGLEALTFAFYILVAIDLNRSASAEAGLKYLLLGAVAAAFLAFGIALIYTGSGSLAIDAAMRASAGDNLLVRAGWGIMLIGLAFKASLVPAHLWTPDVYQGAPATEFGFASEEAAFGLQFGHGVGLSIWEKPIFSRMVSLDHPEVLQEGMVFALETYWPGAAGWC